MDNVLFFPIWTVSPHFETDLELMMREAENNNKIYILFCKGELKICDNNLNMSKTHCKKCIRKRKLALKIMNLKNIELIYLREYNPIRSEYPLPFINDLYSLKKLKIESYHIGYAIASSLAEKLDTSSFESCREQISLLFSEAYSFYECIKKIINDYNISKGYILNARFCFSRAFFQVFLDKNIPIYNHDRGATFNKYEIIKNKLFHDINNYAERLNSFWSKEQDIVLKKDIADSYFKDRYFGKPTNYISFTNEQDIRKLPEDVNMYKKIVVFFTSSDFEFDYTSDEYTYKFYNSQSDGIMKIVDSLKNCSDIGIYVREHPNQRNRNNKQRTALKEIHADNFHLIPAESEISSYALLTKANVVITFNSTMGIEATYWGIPSILCSNAIYEKFNIAYQPSSHEEVINMTLSNLKPIIGDDVLKYGYYNSASGIEYKYYKPIDFFQGYFLGRNLQHRKIDLLKNILRKNFPVIYEKLKRIKKAIV